ncbi:biotin--[acetyl-CoA-carboxylase] ligase [Pseudoruegeria sp. HB172150]|uniref:biotin--[acetyl-CoA-carboxylase] ligase n=1 Tax=Pseudoruegeria sp. HB172150 TaxID=2721164 RepID=UPI0020A63ABF|nr:biotin--[acetyl-CoA-carboxylase] ligase [Pseudoruegeria sp. HB172150]
MSTDLPQGWPDGYAQIVLDETDSTLDEARRRLPELSGPAWILAKHQTAARGRRGRTWQHPPGNFAATLVLPQAGEPAQAALRSFVTALALHDAFLARCGTKGVFQLKWPNDVLLNGGKVAGILLEGLPGGALAIGIGINLAQAPGADAVEQGAVPPVSLAQETQALVSPTSFLATLAPAYAKWETQFTTYGFAPIRSAWLMRAARLGDTITARLPNEAVTGRFDTVDEAGYLVLNTAQGSRAIAAAEVFF